MVIVGGLLIGSLPRIENTHVSVQVQNARSDRSRRCCEVCPGASPSVACRRESVLRGTRDPVPAGITQGTSLPRNPFSLNEVDLISHTAVWKE